MGKKMAARGCGLTVKEGPEVLLVEEGKALDQAIAEKNADRKSHEFAFHFLAPISNKVF